MRGAGPRHVYAKAASSARDCVAADTMHTRMTHGRRHVLNRSTAVVATRSWWALDDDNILVPYRRAPLIASGLLALSIFSGGALAADAATPEPHWSGLPIWGAEAEARGYQIPLPFGIGVTAYSARQPVNIQDLQLGRNGKAPVSVKNFLQIDTGGHVPAERLGEVRRPGLPVSGRLRPRSDTRREPPRDSSRFPAIPSWASSSPGNFSSMPRSMARPTAQVSPSRGVPRSATGAT